MYKYTVELECIVPMLHFQRACNDKVNKDDSATLRGAEFKPMLDKFICQVLKNAKFIHNTEYLLPVDNNVKSFRYSIQIKEKGNKLIKPLEVENATSIKFFLEKYIEKNKLHLYSPNLEVTFRSEHKEIIEGIKKILPFFIAFTQFGFRKGKGFGQFKIKNTVGRKGALINISKSLDYSLLECDFEVKLACNKWLKNVDKINAYIKQKLIQQYAEQELVINTEKDLVNTNNQKNAERRYIRVITGLPTQIAGHKVSHKAEKIERFENTFKYYTDENIGKLYILIRKDKIKDFLDCISSEAEFKIGNTQIKAPNFGEIEYDKFVKFLKTNLPNIKELKLKVEILCP